MNEPLLQLIKQHITEEPRRLQMLNWILNNLSPLTPTNPPCGTAACIAGWAVLLSDDFAGGHSGTMSQAVALLYLSSPEANRLFFLDNWPVQYSRTFVATNDQAERARIACDRIDYFIKTNGSDVERR